MCCSLLRPEKPADQRNVADDRGAIFGLLHIFPHQAAEHDSLAVPHAHARRDFAGVEDRLVNDVRREDAAVVVIPRALIGECLDRAAVVDESFKLDHLWDKVEIDRDTIGPDHRLDFQRDTGIARLKTSRSRRCDRECVAG